MTVAARAIADRKTLGHLRFCQPIKIAHLSPKSLGFVNHDNNVASSGLMGPDPSGFQVVERVLQAKYKLFMGSEKLPKDSTWTAISKTNLNMDNTLHPANAHKQRCPRCQSPLNTVVVHGHEQCVVCKSNIFECCSGDTCETDHNLAVGYKRG